MRDLFVTLVVFASLPLILYRPYIGVIMWSWLSYMNPHKLAWGFATTLPFAQIVALTTLSAMLFSREPKQIPWTREVIVLTLFILWMCLSTAFALEPDLAFVQLQKVLKIQLITFVTLMLITSRERINLLAWTIALSLGFYGVKGGIFTVMTGGGFHVMGPSTTFIAGNNEIGLALLMTLPIIRYLQLQAERKYIRQGLLAAFLLCFVAILGTQSRGALIGLIAVGLFLIWKSPNRLAFLLPLVIVVPLALNFMPETWWERMVSIQTYQEDGSAQGRFNAWGFAFNLALDRPLTGGGYEVFRQPWFYLYAPSPNDVHDAHSIYFEVLGEQGFVGLGLFLLLGIFSWRTGSWIIKNTKGEDGLRWASDLARMLQVTLIAYASSGTFLGLAYFDLYYHIVAMLVVTRVLVTKELVETEKIQQELRAQPVLNM